MKRQENTTLVFSQRHINFIKKSLEVGTGKKKKGRLLMSNLKCECHRRI